MPKNWETQYARAPLLSWLASITAQALLDWGGCYAGATEYSVGAGISRHVILLSQGNGGMIHVQHTTAQHTTLANYETHGHKH